MNKPLFRRYRVLAAVGVASLALTACGGGSDSEGPLAAEPQARSLAIGEPDAAGNADADATAQDSDDVIAADAGAASQELN